MWQCSKKVVRCFIEDVLRRAVPPQHLFLQTGGGVASLPLERATPGVGKADLRFVLHTVCDSLYHNGGWGQRKRRYVYLGLKIMPLLCYNLWFFPYLFLFFFQMCALHALERALLASKLAGLKRAAWSVESIIICKMCLANNETNLCVGYGAITMLLFFYYL